MGAESSIPQEDLQDLIETTKFKQTELKRWYRKFRRDYPSGKMDKENFYDLFVRISSTADSSAADHMFRFFDHDHDGKVDFTELMSALSVTRSGSVTEKIEWIFDIYDVDGDGFVTLDELCDVVSCMQGANGQSGHASAKLLSPEKLEMVFIEADGNNDGKLTLDEFIEATESLPELISVLNQFTTKTISKSVKENN